MKTPDEVYSEIIVAYRELETIPEQRHLFCAKVDDDDYEDYSAPDQPGDDIDAAEKKSRIDAARRRLETTAWSSLILGIQEVQADKWLPEWKQRTEKFLKKCDACVVGWHMYRKTLSDRLLREFDEDTTAIMETRLHTFDKERIDEGLQRALVVFDQHGAIGSAKLASIDEAAVLGIFEALCCVPYLSIPENRKLFNVVFQKAQEKKPLRLGSGVIPTMTIFLFQDDPYRNRFATRAWENLPPQSLTAERFDWAVSDHLAAAMAAVSKPDVPLSEIQLFWEGILVLLDAMDEALVVHSLRGLQVHPDIYNLAVEHLACNSDHIMALVLKALRALMEKSSRAFWDALSGFSPSHFVMHLPKSPAFPAFLSRSFEESMMVADGIRTVPILVAFVKTLMESLQANKRSDVCETLLSTFIGQLGPDLSGDSDGRATCALAAMTALQLAIEGFLDVKNHLNTGRFPFVNAVINHTVAYKDTIVQAVQLRRGDRYNIGLSQVAIQVVESALALDTKATCAEWRALEKETVIGIALSPRRSADLWDAFLGSLQPGRLDLARAMLMPTLSLRGVQKFLPPRPGHKPVEAVEKERGQFNVEFERVADSIARMIGRVSEFAEADLRLLCSDAQTRTLDPIVAALVHGDDTIQAAGVSLINAITGEDQRSDAIAAMITMFPVGFLMSFSDAVDKVTVDTQSKTCCDPWPPMPNIQACSREIVSALCDTTFGLLRRRALSDGEQRAVRHWWTQEWMFIDHSFQTVRQWSLRQVGKNVLEDYCRDVMELAEMLLAQDGLIASACPAAAANGSEREAKAQTMREILDAPQKFSGGFIEMIQLRDTYLLSVIVSIVVKLFGRLNEYSIPLPAKALAPIRRACTPVEGAPGRYVLNTNMDDTQRAELLSVMIDDPTDSDSDEVEIVSITPLNRTKRTAKKQSSLETWSRAGASPTAFPPQPPSSRTASTMAATATASGSSSSSGSSSIPLRPPSKDVLADLTPHSGKHRLPLEKMIKKPASKAEQKTLIANRQATILARRERDMTDIAKSKKDAIARAQALRAAASGVLTEGSGLSGVSGAFGKEHAPPKKSDLMVDSGSEEEDDDADDDDVSALVQKSTNGKTLDEAERRRRLILARGPVKKAKLQRSAKTLQARLIPPMERLHQAILEWDIFHEGKDPPNGYVCAAVASAYASPTSYRQTFFPLLINEAWRSFVTAKDETMAKPFGIKVITRMSVDNFLEVSTTMPAAANKDRALGEGDIVLLSKASDPLANRTEPHCLARIWKTTYKKDVLEVAYRLSSTRNQILPVLMPGAEFHAIKITNMTTVEREYAALESLQYYDLMDEVLKAEPSPMLKFGDQAVGAVQDTYEVNRGQAVAILNAKENDGFTLVQGPPGTGKTKTIVAMVGALLTGTLRANNAGAVAMNRPGLPAQNNSSSYSSSIAPTAKKLLICAPSNAAVDELVLRLKQGVREMGGTVRKINVLRLGRSEAINAAVKDVTMDELVRAELDKESGKLSEAQADREALHRRAGEVKTKLSDLVPPLEAARCGDDRNLVSKLQREYDELKSEQRRIGAQIDKDKASGNTYAREAEIKRRQVQQKILSEAHVLCATLSGSGHEMFKGLSIEFETVIIDEAAQCVELSALIPLKYGCSKCVLVGDPKQLPPTVLSQSAARYGYDQSLFVRMQTNHPQDVHLLDTQYRMHPEISRFPSSEFYEGRLVDGPGMEKLRQQPWHGHPLLGPYRFFDVEGVQAAGRRGQSLVNSNEIAVAVQLYRRFRADFPQVEAKGKMGIITPYKAQLVALRQRFTEQFGQAIVEDIEFNTTDAFQGRECEIIVFSCVRASPTGGIGFMTDIRRMNVGLTRAKSSLWILGNSRALRQGEYWNQLIEDAKSRQRYTAGNVLSLLQAASVRRPQQQQQRQQQQQQQQQQHLPPPPPPPPSRDVEMKDAYPPPSGPRSGGQSVAWPHQPSQAAHTATADRDRRSGPHGGRIGGGINERGEVVPAAAHGASEVPPIRSSISPLLLKRPLEAGDQMVPPAKRVSSTAPAPPPPRPPRRLTDPSAMEALGLVPPPRPPAPAMQAMQAPPTRGPVVLPPRKKAAVDPFIRKGTKKR